MSLKILQHNLPPWLLSSPSTKQGQFQLPQESESGTVETKGMRQGNHPDDGDKPGLLTLPGTRDDL